MSSRFASYSYGREMPYHVRKQPFVPFGSGISDMPRRVPVSFGAINLNAGGPTDLETTRGRDDDAFSFPTYGRTSSFESGESSSMPKKRKKDCSKKASCKRRRIDNPVHQQFDPSFCMEAVHHDADDTLVSPTTSRKRRACEVNGGVPFPHAKYTALTEE